MITTGQHAYFWSSTVDGPLHSEENLDDLIQVIKTKPLLPNFEKMKKALETKNEYTYGQGVFSIRKALVTE
jgi:hypothetical protein